MADGKDMRQLSMRQIANVMEQALRHA
jgi:hypothetical protein